MAFEPIRSLSLSHSKQSRLQCSTRLHDWLRICLYNRNGRFKWHASPHTLFLRGVKEKILVHRQAARPGGASAGRPPAGRGPLGVGLSMLACVGRPSTGWPVPSRGMRPHGASAGRPPAGRGPLGVGLSMLSCVGKPSTGWPVPSRGARPRGASAGRPPAGRGPLRVGLSMFSCVGRPSTCWPGTLVGSGSRHADTRARAPRRPLGPNGIRTQTPYPPLKDVFPRVAQDYMMGLELKRHHHGRFTWLASPHARPRSKGFFAQGGARLHDGPRELKQTHTSWEPQALHSSPHAPTLSKECLPQCKLDCMVSFVSSTTHHGSPKVAGGSTRPTSR